MSEQLSVFHRSGDPEGSIRAAERMVDSLTDSRALALKVLATWEGQTERKIIDYYRDYLIRKWIDSCPEFAPTAHQLRLAMFNGEPYEEAKLEGVRRRFSDLLALNLARYEPGPDGSRLIKLSSTPWFVDRLGVVPPLNNVEVISLRNFDSPGGREHVALIPDQLSPEVMRAVRSQGKGLKLYGAAPELLSSRRLPDPEAKWDLTFNPLPRPKELTE